MSQAEVKRFLADLKTKPALVKDLKGKATGIASVAAFATANGYSISVTDAREYIRGLTLSGLSDAHLDHIAGGKHHHHHKKDAPQVQQMIATGLAIFFVGVGVGATAAAGAAAAAEVAAVAVVVVT